MRLDYKRRIRRAERLGFTSVVDRFINDVLFRVQMIELGWNQHNIADVDTIGNRPAQENTGRSYHQRWKYEGWYDRHEEDPQGQPNRDLELAPTHIISNLRRRQETQYWKGQSKGEVSHRETDAAKGKAKGKRDSSPKGSSVPRGHSASKGNEKGSMKRANPGVTQKAKHLSRKEGRKKKAKASE